MIQAGVWAVTDCVAAACGTVVKVWSPNDPKNEIKIFEGTNVYSMDFSRNNKVLAVAGDKGQVALYSNNLQGASGDRCVGHTPSIPDPDIDCITCVRFAPTGAHLVCGTKEGPVHIFALRTSQAQYPQRSVTGLTGSATSAAISHNLEMLATASSSGQVLLHDFHTGAKWKSLLDGGPTAGCLGFSRLAPSLLAAATAAGQLLVWDTDTMNLAVNILAHKGVVTGLSFSESNPDLLISCSADSTIKCTDRRTQQSVWTAVGQQPFTALSVKPDGRLIAVGTSGGSVLIQDIRKGPQTLSVQQFSDTSAAVTAVRWQHILRSSKSSSSVSNAAAAPTSPRQAPAAIVGPAGTAATGSGSCEPPTAAQPNLWQQTSKEQGRSAVPAHTSAAILAGAGQRLGAEPGQLVSETSTCSVSVEDGMRAFSPVQLLCGSAEPSDASTAGLGSIGNGSSSIMATPPPQQQQHLVALQSSAESLASRGAAPFMFTPGIGTGHLGGLGSAVTPQLGGAQPADAGSGATSTSRLAVAPASAAAAVKGPGRAAAITEKQVAGTGAAAAAGRVAGASQQPAIPPASPRSSTGTRTGAAAASKGPVASKVSSSSAVPAPSATAGTGRTGRAAGAAAGSNAMVGTPKKVPGVTTIELIEPADAAAAQPTGTAADPPVAAAHGGLSGSRPTSSAASRPGSAISVGGPSSLLAGAAAAGARDVAHLGVGGLREGVFKAYLDEHMAVSTALRAHSNSRSCSVTTGQLNCS
eukprot:GHRR01027543.1.p1 GENE.GHRR01027543.1~~GHRR01027543.1.p1  ORF type:complete len:752 (+),score=310.10 GHRR01027543.1:1196-3451(+)